MVKRLATSPHDPLGITDSACKNQSVVVSVQYGHFNPYIPMRSTTIGKSRVAIDPIAMHTSWRSNSDIASVTSIGYPRMSASGESSTTMHRLLHASGSHPIPTPYDPNWPPPPPLKPHAAAALRRCVPPPSAARFVIGLVSITVTSLKCRFPRETGRSQAPRRQQVVLSSRADDAVARTIPVHRYSVCAELERCKLSCRSAYYFGDSKPS
ncbi:hypothetical protein F511_13033 [Dorcoceras hygrometricum]|uniref:Uncharacterized protein n=1 Tax=Dorcoceras hygrometricum TaxID=472368 RepID=A0A2Z7AAM8_9LAMI|nr:hypothetical protein F511_13033 [Dorcoceras hygrometricum]